MVRHESVITALIGAVLGIGAGLALAAGVVAWLGKYGLELRRPRSEPASPWRSSPPWRACSPPRCPRAGPRGSTS